ncbi:hypothetical protein M430DRAFT_35038 [Amorphotheca resinae ATCC 22711]|uniref:Phytocyanin domain-containing protein n=1 Tax=Amorphotheca resinae ATCC 22711 TaxID=857342 RepID=A0A2T3B1W1_AMORE|nr:hypothetical protein M430DRAFT_35038 [Amorphotheca resinae ATCC 22711]PSS18529.1 hypothetical protein M430DRAFT_35038 [Amorphotheca resinae ATCC 22711]
MYPSFLRFTLTLTFIFTLLSPILCTQAPTTNLTPTTIPIAVGLHGALSFSPNSTSASVGDILEFRFFNGSAPHSVVSGPFGTPCLPGSGGFFSGYLEGNDTFSVTVTTTDPIWYYCSAHKHCQYGMVGVINPPVKAPNSTLAQYAMAAKGVAMAGAPPEVTGGVAGNGSVAASSSAVAPVKPVPTGGVGRSSIAAGGVGIWIVGGVVGAW